MSTTRAFSVLAVGIFLATLLIILFLTMDSNPKSISELESRGKRETEKKRMELDDWLSGKFRYTTVYPRWVSGNEYVTRNGSFVVVDVETGDETPLLPEEAWTSTENPSNWMVSADMEYVAILYNQTDGYAHYVRTFSVDIWEVASGQKLENVDVADEGIQKFKWSTTGHSFTYVYQNNVYIYKNLTSSVQITQDGHEQLMFNGISDWLFSIEITDDDALLWWSPDGDYLAFAKINQTKVMQFEFTVFNEQQYPRTIRLPYPKPGTPIPLTTLWVVDLETLTPLSLEPGVDDTWDGYYLNSAVWRGNIFTPTWKNRFENEAITENCQAPSFTCSHGENMRISSDTGWLGHYKISHTFPLNNSDEYLTVESHEGFPHVTLHNTADDAIDVRTSGQFEATDTGSGYESIHFHDPINDWVYFTSTENPFNLNQGLPRIRHVWRVKGHGDNKTRDCITCDLNTMYENRCNWVTPTFSIDGSWLVVNCGGTSQGVPITILHKLDTDGNYAYDRVLADNKQLQDTIDEYYFRSVEFGTLQLPDVEGDWYYMLLKPPNFDPNKKYPLLVQVYSGPAYQEVEDRFSVSWKDYVASSEEVVVMSFDGRGTGFRGDQIMHMVYKKLGQYEPLDQIAAARIIGEKHSYIDQDRRAIWGWSYGGYATSRTIGEDFDNVYRCGFAVAPVTKWELYHTIYTERYMTDQDLNPDGYEKSSTLQNWENFQSHRYSVFHGTRDENVHFQNAAQLSKYLIEHEVDFRAYFAADDDHGMGRVPNNYRTIYKMLTHQMDICFK